MKGIVMKYQEIVIPVGHDSIKGDLHLVNDAAGIVIFAHGSGSSRLSTRNKFVARYLQQAGISTLLFDLLTEREDEVDQITRQFRFDIPLLADRLILVTKWLAAQPYALHAKLGYFGASTGAAAALIAAAALPSQIRAIVSRGGRPDLANASLDDVRAATLLIVGELDTDVIELNKQAYAHLHCIKQITLIPGATHLFEEPGTLEQAAMHASDWFLNYFK